MVRMAERNTMTSLFLSGPSTNLLKSSAQQPEVVNLLGGETWPFRVSVRRAVIGWIVYS